VARVLNELCEFPLVQGAEKGNRFPLRLCVSEGFTHAKTLRRKAA
jgi:hypothetical protein